MRCFVAVVPGQPVLPRLVGLVGGLRGSWEAGRDTAGDPATGGPGRPVRVRWTDPDRWHVTLAFFADADTDALRSRLSGVRWSEPDPVVAEARPRLATFPGVVYVPVAGLDALAGWTRQALAGVADGAASDRSRFVGHLTVGRFTPSGPGLSGLDSLGDPGTGAVAWEVVAVDLVGVEPADRGSGRYRTLASFPLA